MHMFGFTSWKDFFEFATGFQYRRLAFIDIILSSQLAVFSMFGFVDQWIWSPVYSLFVYFIMLMADFASGLAVGIWIKKEGFKTQKAQRLILIFPAHLVILGVLFNAGRINHDMGIQGINDGIFTYGARAFYFYVLGINLLSFIKNCVLLGLIQGQVATWFANYIDTHKNESKNPEDGK